MLLSALYQSNLILLVTSWYPASKPAFMLFIMSGHKLISLKNLFSG